jgi:hypothetical protein
MVAPSARPTLDLSAAMVSQTEFRGVPQSDTGAFQVELSSTLPARNGAVLGFEVFGNLDWSDENDGGALGGDHGGQFSRLDLEVSYTRLYQDLEFSTGLRSYSFPGVDRAMKIGAGGPFQGDDTAALFASFGWEWRTLFPTLEVFWDFDQADGVYLRGSVSRGWQMDERTSAVIETWLGVTDGNHAEYAYGTDEGGLADLGLRGSMYYQWRPNVRVRGTLGGSTLLGSGLEDTLGDAGIDTDNLWAGIGLSWSW